MNAAPREWVSAEDDAKAADEVAAMLGKMLAEHLPGIEFNIGRESSEVLRVQARRRVELFEANIDTINVMANEHSAQAFATEVIKRARAKVVDDYGLVGYVKAEREDAARQARIEFRAALLNKIDQRREYIDALDDDGKIVKVRGPLPYKLATLRAWVAGTQ